jgi:MFS family permease
MRAFWHLGLASLLHIAACSAVTLHIMPYLTSLGVERTTASMVAMAMSMVSTPARFVFGWLADIFQKRCVFATSIALTSLGLFFLSRVDPSSLITVLLPVIFFGLGLGGTMPIRAPIVREYFGPRNFGTIYGLQFIFMTSGMVISPPLAGWVFDARGVYHPIWLILSGVAAAGALVMIATPLASRSRDSSPDINTR